MVLLGKMSENRNRKPGGPVSILPSTNSLNWSKGPVAEYILYYYIFGLLSVMVTMVVGSLQSHKQQYASDIGNLIFPNMEHGDHIQTGLD